jgi:hypothetical protein
MTAPAKAPERRRARWGKGRHGTAATARHAPLRLCEEDRIGDGAPHKTLRETDIKAWAAEGPTAALPGADPPNP